MMKIKLSNSIVNNLFTVLRRGSPIVYTFSHHHNKRKGHSAKSFDTMFNVSVVIMFIIYSFHVFYIFQRLNSSKNIKTCSYINMINVLLL